MKSKDTTAPAPQRVLVRILRHGTRALGGILAKGAQVRMPKPTAETLQSTGHATIIGA